jgi:hypothetical protein
MLSLFPYSGINEILPYLMGVLGLLMTWELHDLEVRTGHIHGLDISDPSAVRTWLRNCSGARMYVYATPDDFSACEACRKANHTVISPALVRRRQTCKAPVSSCVNPAGCRCVLVGLRGRWPAAETLSIWLHENNNATAFLTAEEMTQLLTTADAGGSTLDRLGIYLLEALRAERANPQFAITRYRHLIIRAKDGRGHPFAIPAYLRLSDLLERAGRLREALDVMEDFYANVRHKKGPHAPTVAQSSLLSVRRSRLRRRLRHS